VQPYHFSELIVPRARPLCRNVAVVRVSPCGSVIQYVLRSAFTSWLASLPAPETSLPAADKSLTDLAASVGVRDVPSLRVAWAEVLRDSPGSLVPLTEDASHVPIDVAAAAVTVLADRLRRLSALEYVHTWAGTLIDCVGACWPVPITTSHGKCT
jgi:hypothetical protein